MDHLEIFVLLITFTVSVIYVLNYIFTSRGTTTSNSNDHLKKCESPGCVRCNLYGKVLADATERLRNLCQQDTNSMELQRIHNSFGRSVPKDTRQKPGVFRLENLTAMPWWTANFHFVSDTEKLEGNYTTILAEFWRIKTDSRAVWKVNNTPSGQWKVLHLINQGKIQRDNVDICAETFKIVSSLPSVMTENVFANVAFSIIEAGTVITEHYGPTNIRLRCHLGLVTPKCCELCVAGDYSYWRRGVCLVFDDSFLHSVTHDGSCSEPDKWRAVLIVDLWHPGVTGLERSAINTIFK